MKFSVDELRELDRATGGAGAGTAEAAGEAVSDVAGEAAETAVGSRPTMDVNMGPDGTQVGISAPLEDMSAEQAIKFAQDIQTPSLQEQVTGLLKDNEVRAALRAVWYGQGGNQNEQQAAAPSQPAQEHPDSRPLPDSENDTPTMNDIDIDGDYLAQLDPDDDGVIAVDADVLYHLLLGMIANIQVAAGGMTVNQVAELYQSKEDDVKAELRQTIAQLEGASGEPEE